MLANIDTFLAWFSGHRAKFGGFFIGLSAILAGAGQTYTSPETTNLGMLFFTIGSTLMAAGMSESDKSKRERQKVIETKIDRRNPDSLVNIPVRDLRKLVEEKK